MSAAAGAAIVPADLRKSAALRCSSVNACGVELGAGHAVAQQALADAGPELVATPAQPSPRTGTPLASAHSQIIHMQRTDWKVGTAMPAHGGKAHRDGDEDPHEI